MSRLFRTKPLPFPLWVFQITYWKTNGRFGTWEPLKQRQDDARLDRYVGRYNL